MYVYIRSEPGLWTVGFYNPDGNWEAESDHSDTEKAANRVAWLNGSLDLDTRIDRLSEYVNALIDRLDGVVNKLDSRVSDLEYRQLDSIKSDIYSLESKLSDLGRFDR